MRRKRAGAGSIIKPEHHVSPFVAASPIARSTRVVMGLVKEAAAVRFERAVHSTRGPTGVRARWEVLAAAALCVVANGQVALDQIDLLPVFVNKGLGREHAGGKAQEASAAAAAPLFVEGAGQDLLLDAGRVAGRGRPPGTHVDAVKFEMRLVDGHEATFLSLLSAPHAAC